MKTKLKLFFVAFISCFFACLESQSADGPDSFDRWNESQFVFTGNLQDVIAGPVGRSLPPVYTHQLEFKVDQVFRGELKPKATIVASHIARQEKRPTFPEEKECLVAASLVRGKIQISHIEIATAEKLMDISLACSLPLGWKVVKGKPISPWASLGDSAWSDKIELTSSMKCDATSRPALLNGNGIKLTVEKVPPPKEIKWTNPDGDGEYKITVTNTNESPMQVQSLLTSEDDILWKESMVILCQKKAYPIPGAKGVSKQVKPLLLKAGQSVSTVVNTLELDGPEWPRGGYRIEFQFCLGEASQTESFYYMSRHHDKIRESLSKKKR